VPVRRLDDVVKVGELLLVPDERVELVVVHGRRRGRAGAVSGMRKMTVGKTDF
jgi:hypothetical protein